MAQPTPGAPDQAMLLLSGTVSGAVPSGALQIQGLFNFVLTGAWTGTIGLQLSYDGGTTWVPLPSGPDGAPLSLSQPTSLGVNVIEAGTLLRVVPNLSAGAANWRISR